MAIRHRNATNCRITEIITFGIPDGMTREDVVANYRRSAPSWRANPDLIRKNYLYDAESPSRGRRLSVAHDGRARRARNAAWLERVRTTHGSEPVVQYFETPIAADNPLGRTIDEEG